MLIISQTATDTAIVAIEDTGNPTQSFKWYHFLWLSVTSKSPFIATQLNSTRRRRRLFADATQLDVELRRCRHPHWVTTFRTDRWQLFVTLWTCRQLDVELSCVGVAIDTLPTQLNSTRRRVELCRYKLALPTFQGDDNIQRQITRLMVLSRLSNGSVSSDLEWPLT